MPSLTRWRAGNDWVGEGTRQVPSPKVVRAKRRALLAELILSGEEFSVAKFGDFRIVRSDLSSTAAQRHAYWLFHEERRLYFGPYATPVDAGQARMTFHRHGTVIRNGAWGIYGWPRRMKKWRRQQRKN